MDYPFTKSMAILMGFALFITFFTRLITNYTCLSQIRDVTECAIKCQLLGDCCRVFAMMPPDANENQACVLITLC